MERLCEEADNWPRGFVLETFRQAFLQLFFQTDQNCLLHKIQEDNVYIMWLRFSIGLCPLCRHEPKLAPPVFFRVSENLTRTDLVNCQSRWEMRFLNNNFLHHRGPHLGKASKKCTTSASQTVGEAGCRRNWWKPRAWISNLRSSKYGTHQLQLIAKRMVSDAQQTSELLSGERQSLWSALRCSITHRFEYWLQTCYPSAVEPIAA